MLRRVALVGTNFPEERWFLQEPHGVKIPEGVIRDKFFIQGYE
jgi:hypothetical protein